MLFVACWQLLVASFYIFNRGDAVLIVVLPLL